ncbi:MAG TPA: hypothetical protein VNX68_12905 [Nitrosopumilaceae archaeon]|jgi:hypothetical protein|nr:hypothetical protein [Nitrosopumilaceae archaeon]
MKNLILSIIAVLCLMSCKKEAVTQPSIVNNQSNNTSGTVHKYHLINNNKSGMVNGLIINKDTIDFYAIKTPPAYYTNFMTTGDTTILVKKGDIINSIYYCGYGFNAQIKLDGVLIQDFTYTNSAYTSGQRLVLTDTIK